MDTQEQTQQSDVVNIAPEYEGVSVTIKGKEYTQTQASLEQEVKIIKLIITTLKSAAQSSSTIQELMQSGGNPTFFDIVTELADYSPSLVRDFTSTMLNSEQAGKDVTLADFMDVLANFVEQNDVNRIFQSFLKVMKAMGYSLPQIQQNGTQEPSAS